MDLGDKVTCKGYLKKTGNFIEIENNDKTTETKIYLSNYNSKEHLDYRHFWIKELEDEELIEVKKIIYKTFEGFICGKKKIHTQIYTCYCEDGGYRITPHYEFRKNNFIECYEVCYKYRGRFCKRYVPTNLCKKIA